MRKKIIKIYGIILAVLIPYAIIAMVTGWGLPCVTRKLTGLMCPGCGVSRMFLSMIRLDFKSAFFHNQAMFVLFFAWNLIAALAFVGKPRFVRNVRFLLVFLSVSVLFLVIFTIFRNLY